MSTLAASVLWVRSIHCPDGGSEKGVGRYLVYLNVANIYIYPLDNDLVTVSFAQ